VKPQATQLTNETRRIKRDAAHAALFRNGRRGAARRKGGSLARVTNQRA
jgi:hypothetical protein